MLGEERLERKWIDYLGMSNATQRLEHQRKLRDKLIFKHRHRISESLLPLSCYVEGVKSKVNREVYEPQAIFQKLKVPA
jgi:hypothetical protein